MRLYILTISRYVIAGTTASFALLSWVRIAIRGEAARTAAEIAQVVIMAAALGTAYLALGAGLRQSGIFLLGIVHVLVLCVFLVLVRILCPEADHLLWNNVCMLLGMGGVMLSRLSPDLAIRQAVICAGGLALALILPALRRHLAVMRRGGYAFAAAGIAALLLVFVLGRTVNGSLLNYSILGVTFQPSEFVKILFVLFLAGVFCGEPSWKNDFAAGALALAHVGILVLCRDLGGAVIFFVAYVLVFYLARGHFLILASGILTGAAGAVMCYHLFRHVRVRVQAFIDPWSVIDNMGYQITQSLFAIGYGGPFGAGLTQGAPDRIPFVESDFIFSAIAEEMGMIAAVSLILVFLSCFLSLILLSMNMADRFGQLAAFGAGVVFIFQTFLTIGGGTRFIPLTGVTLPFVSYGGSSVLSMLLMFALVEIVHILHEERIEGFRERYEEEVRRRQNAAPPARRRP